MPVNPGWSYPAPVVSLCPTCREPLAQPGALRCRSCGADARGAPAAPGVVVRLDQVVPPGELAALGVFDQLRQAAPAVAEWYRATDDAGRRLVEQLLAELRRLRRPGG